MLGSTGLEPEKGFTCVYCVESGVVIVLGVCEGEDSLVICRLV